MSTCGSTATASRRSRSAAAGSSSPAPWLAAAFVAIGVRLVDVTVLQAGVEPRDLPPTQIARGAAAKTEITDRNGVVLAVSLGTAALYANTAWIDDVEATVQALEKVLPDLDRARTLERLRISRRYVSLRRHLTPNEQYGILRLGMPGLVLEPDQRRVYPMGNLAAHVVGFSDPDGSAVSPGSSGNSTPSFARAAARFPSASTFVSSTC